jgi:hypothetical protein
MARDINTVGQYDMVAPVGATFQRAVVWRAQNKDPIDITGYDCVLSIKRKKTDQVALLTLTSTPAAGIAIGGTDGTVGITITAAQTEALGVGTFVYDLELDDGSGVITRLIEGTVEVTRGVTS